MKTPDTNNTTQNLNVFVNIDKDFGLVYHVQYYKGDPDDENPERDLIDLMAQTARDWCTETERGKEFFTYKKKFTWHDMLVIPSNFTARHGFVIKNHSCTGITVDNNTPIIP